MVQQSLWAHSRCEIERHKWIESEKAKRDLGEAAIFDWINVHWNGYLRQRWLEHLLGKTFWPELDRGDFGLLATKFQDQLPLINEIIERLKVGQENVNITWWAADDDARMSQVRAILDAIDIN